MNMILIYTSLWNGKNDKSAVYQVMVLLQLDWQPQLLMIEELYAFMNHNVSMVKKTMKMNYKKVINY